MIATISKAKAFLSKYGAFCSKCKRLRRWYDYEAVKNAEEERKTLCAECHRKE